MFSINATGCWKAAAVLAQPLVKRLLSSEHFSVDGALIEAWAHAKGSKPKDLASRGPKAVAAMPLQTT